MPRNQTSTKAFSKQPISSPQVATSPPLPHGMDNDSSSIPPTSSPADQQKVMTHTNQSPAPSSHTATPPVTPAPAPVTPLAPGPPPVPLQNPPFEWVMQRRRPVPCTPKSPDSDNGPDERQIQVFEVEGILEDFLLRPHSLSHFVHVQLSTADINNIKQIVRTAPGHVEAGFRWPFEGNIGKFTSKDVKANLAQDFQPIMDGTHLENWRDFEGNLGDFNLEDLVEGTKVGIEYSPVPFGGRKATANDAGYDGGCTLKLYAIIVLPGGEKRPTIATTSPSKRMRLVY
jgi:hypothetical protein